MYLKLLCFILAASGGVARGNFSNCLQTMVDNLEDAAHGNGSWPTGYTRDDLRNNTGGIVINLSDATAMSFASCQAACGKGNSAGSLATFSDKFNSWVLPSVAILSQLPFGSYHGRDDFIAVILTLGSPALASYSLAITVLNGRWITALFRDVSAYGAAPYAVRCLRSLQQSPIRLSKDSIRLASLVVLQKNDEFWERLANTLEDEASTWTYPAIFSITWVIIAYVLTVINSFVEFDTLDTVDAVGAQAIGCAWCFLVAIVAGWLIVSPKCNARRIALCLRNANEHAFVADSTGPVAATRDAFQIVDGASTLLHNLQCSPPIYNYARFHSWTEMASKVHCFYSNAHYRAGHHRRSSNELEDATSRTGSAMQVLQQCQDLKGRLAAYSLSSSARWKDVVVASLAAMTLQWFTIGGAIIAFLYTPSTGLGCRSLSYIIYGSLSTVIWIMLLVSSWLAYKADVPLPVEVWDMELQDNAHNQLTGDVSDYSLNHEAVNVDAAAPSMPSPLHSRNPSKHTLEPYHIAAIAMPEANVFSTSNAPEPTTCDPAFAERVSFLDSEHDTAEPNTRGYHSVTWQSSVYAATAIALRWFATIAATFNALVFIALCAFEFLGIFNNCYCDASVLGNGADKAFVVVKRWKFPNDTPFNAMRAAYIGSVVISLVGAIGFIGFVYTLLPASRGPREDGRH